MPDKSVRADLIYLCSPNNPTGAVYNRAQLAQWVEYANSIGAVIIYDAAYEAFISGRAIPTSIFQIAGAEKCAIEICSLSKTAGFTGVRCGWTTVPHGLVRGGVELNALWNRRQTTKTNGVSYVVQRAAQAALAPEGVRETRKNILYYRRNARLMMRFLTEIGVEFVGGKDAPYVWLKCPNGMTSWGFFDFMLARFGIVGTAGVGFGSAGEGYLRLSAFAARETIAEAIKRVKDQGFC
jgi:LL-diaminopimelate aminotransferase